MAVFDDGEPLPVGMGIGGKIREKGVLRVIQKAKGSREDRLAVTLADALEHAIIPELRREEPGDRFRVSLVNAGKEEHFAAPAQLVLRGEGTRIDGLLLIAALGLLSLGLGDYSFGKRVSLLRFMTIILGGSSVLLRENWKL